ncbi:hypothetical protein [Amycolatopsis sp. FU40]|nr:hypothetical protein [Amycolatopsis sp. FU40]
MSVNRAGCSPGTLCPLSTRTTWTSLTSEAIRRASSASIAP